MPPRSTVPKQVRTPADQAFIVTKVCARCSEDKPLDAFNRRRASPDGRQAWCRDCFATHQRENTDAYREYALRHRTRNPESGRRRQAQWRARHPEVHAARSAEQYARATQTGAARARNRLNRAVRGGKIVRPDACEQCGSTDRQIQGSHDHDKYGDPAFDLVVQWLCPPCHWRRDHPEGGDV